MELKDKNLYYVGGYVRDKFLGCSSVDIDYCYEGSAIEYAKNLNVIRINPAFGTVRVLYNNQEIDIASTRTETYPKKGHLPQILKIGCALEDDLSRRDFAINSMAINTLTGRLVDPYGGNSDIEKKELSVLHDESFIDDPTRIIRGLKFSVRFGFKLSEHTFELQNAYLNNVNYDMSYHRLLKELKDAFSIINPQVFVYFIESKMYTLLSKENNAPKIDANWMYNEIISNSSPYSWLIPLSFFDLSRLPLTRQELKIITWAEKLKTQPVTNNTPMESIIIRRIHDGI